LIPCRSRSSPGCDGSSTLTCNGGDAAASSQKAPGKAKAAACQDYTAAPPNSSSAIGGEVRTSGTAHVYCLPVQL
jgi:hypothetical protein